MSTIRMNLGPRSYDIVIKRSVLNSCASELDLDRKVLVVTDSKVPVQYAKTVAANCKEGSVFTFESGESNKNIATWQRILEEMCRLGFTRKDCVVAVGGGVAGDMAGFAAASYMRGVDFYNIPTTVLSQVDSSIGGKTAVDLGTIKNIVGAFYQPKKVLVDPNVLESLHQRQISNGLAEALKMACTFDEELFKLFLDADGYKDLYEQIDTVIEKSLLCKKYVVEQDERESGLRKVLNFGHTIGHGIEGSCGGTLLHGECVALGMLPMCSSSVYQKLKECITKLEIPTKIKMDPEAVCSLIAHDKKSANNAITTVWCDAVGTYTMKKQTVGEIKKLLPIIQV